MDEFLVELKCLAMLVGGLPPEWWKACAFVSGLPQHVRQLLLVLAKMNTLTLDQILTWAIMIDVKEPEG